MIKKDNSKRAFFKKAAAAVGVVAAAGYTKTLISESVDSAKEIGNKYIGDIKSQEATILQQKMVLMTDNEKKEMLNEIIDSHNMDRT